MPEHECYRCSSHICYCIDQIPIRTVLRKGLFPLRLYNITAELAKFMNISIHSRLNVDEMKKYIVEYIKIKLNFTLNHVNGSQLITDPKFCNLFKSFNITYYNLIKKFRSYILFIIK